MEQRYIANVAQNNRFTNEDFVFTNFTTYLYFLDFMLAR